MGSIHLLDTLVSNKIAAGEVVERPASVIKELVENSIDANATSITIEIENGGISYIRVADNGFGMTPVDAATSLLRHATSKLNKESDLFSIATLGFRGEALASIAAVSNLVLKTHAKSSAYGTRIYASGGKIGDNEPCGCPDGTSIEVSNLFFNVPARLKFLKASRVEAGYISDYILRMILARPDISFKLISNGKPVYHSIGDGNLINAIYSVYGSDFIPFIKKVTYSNGYVSINGFIGNNQLCRPTRNYQSFFVNDRYIRSKLLSDALMSAYDTRIMVGKFPFAAVSLCVAYSDVDVNVHPNKMEIRFKEEQLVSDALTLAAKKALGISLAPNAFTSIPNVSGSVADKFNSVADDFNSVADKFNSVADDFNSVADDFNSVADVSVADVSVADVSVADVSVAEVPDSVAEKTNNTSSTEQIVDKILPQNPTVRVLNQKEAAIPSVSFGQAELIPAVKTPEPEIPSTQTEFSIDPFEILGCAFDSFWFVRQNDTVFIVDQHAAHERRLYEGTMKRDLKAERQTLLIPIVVLLSASEFTLYIDNKATFASLGFEIEEFGPLTIRITALPNVLGNLSNEDFFHEALAMISKNRSLTVKEANKSAIISASCKAAVKLNTELPSEFISQLLDEYKENGIPLTCPHGRPVMVAITKNALYKMFKRIV